MKIIIILLLIANIKIAHSEEEAAPATSATNAYSNILTFKELYLPLNQRPDSAYSNMVRMSLSLELNDKIDYPIIEKKTDQIQEKVADYISNVSVDDLTDNDAIYKMKMDLLSTIDDLISPIKIKAIYLTDIIVQ